MKRQSFFSNIKNILGFQAEFLCLTVTPSATPRTSSEVLAWDCQPSARTCRENRVLQELQMEPEQRDEGTETAIRCLGSL